MPCGVSLADLFWYLIAHYAIPTGLKYGGSWLPSAILVSGFSLRVSGFPGVYHQLSLGIVSSLY